VLSEAELDAVVVGAKTSPPSSRSASGKIFEIDDFSFDTEQVLN
jgi:hypothetical protein